MQKTLVPFLLCLSVSPAVGAQAGQLIGARIDATTAIRGALGFGGADDFAGVCRDNAGNYWTSCRSNGQRFLIRLDPTGAFSGFITTAIGMNDLVRDFAFDSANGHLWVAYRFSGSNASTARVYDVGTGALLGDVNQSFPGGAGGIAWDGANLIRVAGTAQSYSTATRQGTTAASGIPYAYRGLLYDPTADKYWGGQNSAADPMSVTAEKLEELPAAVTLPPHLEGISIGSRAGGRFAGCEQWFDPALSEWVGVFAQRGDNDAFMLYTAHLSRPTGPGCGGPMFTNGPAIVQTQVYSSASNAQSLAWLLISLAPGAVTDPLLAPGCVAHLDPLAVIALGPLFPSASGNVDAATTIPVSASFQELPLWFQWGTIASIANTATLGEARCTVIKQF